MNKQIKYSEPFKNLFTQGMVCHETYKDQNNNWLYPDEITKLSNHEAIKNTDKSKVFVGPPESMSKSKKNTIDPEVMITRYGADSVRWFILSDSPPEKDVQWSDQGVNSANKFHQKIWDLNNQIMNLKGTKNLREKIKNLEVQVNLFTQRITKSIENFQFNVSIALFYEVYKILRKGLEEKISKDILIKNMTVIMRLLIPFTPHLAFECLSLLGEKNFESWPRTDENLVSSEIKIKMPIQINGKTRDILEVKKDLSEQSILKIVLKSTKIKKYTENKEIFRTIFVKNKIFNYIIK